MGLLDNIRKWGGYDQVEPQTETKAIVGVDELGRTNPINSNYNTYSSGVTLANNIPVTFVNRKDAELNMVFYTIVNRIQTASRSIPWAVYYLTKKDENGDKMPNHPLSDLIYKPNSSNQTWSDFIVNIIGNYLSSGNVYIYFIRNAKFSTNAGKPVQMWLMPASTEVITTGGWMPTITGYKVPGEQITYSPDDVLHIKKDINSLYGVSPLEMAIAEISSINAAVKQRIKQATNGGVKQAVFVQSTDNVDTDLTEEQEQALKAKLNRDSNFEFSPVPLGTVELGLSPKDLDLLNSINADAGRIADMLGYPSVLLSGNKNSTYNNISEANKALYTTVKDLLTVIKEALNGYVDKFYTDKPYIDFDTSNVESLKPNLSELINAVNSAQFLTVNEMRKATGYAAIDGGDGFLRSAALSYVTKIDDEAASDPADAYEADDNTVIDG